MFPSLAIAEIVVGESIEWLVDSSEMIGIYYGVKKEKTKAYSVVKLKVKLKGNPPSIYDSELASYRPKEERNKIPKACDFLVFFNYNQDKISIHYNINLTFPQSIGSYGVALTKDCNVLTNGDDILKLVKSRIKLNIKVPKMVLLDGIDRMSPPSSSFIRIRAWGEAEGALWAGSACYLVVPADDDFKIMLLKQSQDEKNVWKRATATRWLAVYPEKSTIQILQSLLKNSDTALLQQIYGDIVSNSFFTEEITVYPVRQAAYEALTQLGVRIEKTEGLREPFRLDFYGVWIK